MPLIVFHLAVGWKLVRMSGALAAELGGRIVVGLSRELSLRKL